MPPSTRWHCLHRQHRTIPLRRCKWRLLPLSLLLRDGQEQLELRRELLLRVEAVGEVDAPDAAVGVYLHPQGLDVVRSVRSTREVAKVELDLVPPLCARTWA